MFPDDPAAMKWFESQRWPEERRCPRCDSNQTSIAKSHPTMPYRCRKCRQFFSVRTGTVLEYSRIGYREWAIAIYMATTSLKGVSSMKLYRNLGITPKAAWHLMQRICKGFEGNTGVDLKIPTEADKTYVVGHIMAKKQIPSRGRPSKRVLNIDATPGEVVQQIFANAKPPNPALQKPEKTQVKNMTTLRTMP